MPHVMHDLETLGTRPGCVIRSLGACTFDTDLAGTAFFYANITEASCLEAGLTVDPATQKWWDDQGQAAKAWLLDGQKPLKAVLWDYGAWFTRQNPAGVWAHGASFDHGILAAAYAALGMPTPWHFSQERDTRTLYELANVRPNRDVGIPHYALDDAKAQALAAHDAMRKIRAALAPDEGAKQVHVGATQA